jgi:hypothetical protein
VAALRRYDEMLTESSGGDCEKRDGHDRIVHFALPMDSMRRNRDELRSVLFGCSFSYQCGKRTRRPVVLTVNGKAEFVVQDAESYQRILDRLERLQAVEAIRAGIAAAEEGRVRPAR